MDLFTRTCKSESMNAQRLIARIMLVIGGLFWIYMAFGAQYAYKGVPIQEAVTYALPFVAGIAFLFIVAMFFEYVAALMLAIGIVGLIGFGIISSWEVGVWVTALFFLALPMALAALLFVLAARMQKICELNE